jgi:hypothetical protein
VSFSHTLAIEFAAHKGMILLWYLTSKKGNSQKIGHFGDYFRRSDDAKISGDLRD